MKPLFISFFFLAFYAPLQAQTATTSKPNDYQQAWNALNKNDFKSAKTLLLKAAKDPQFRDDALSTLVIVDSYLGREDSAMANYRNPLVRMKNPQDYFFAFWFNKACMGTYGKMDSAHLANANYILSHSELFNGSMQASAHYFKGLNDVLRLRMDKAHAEFAQMGAVRNWEFTGPFDNISGSGFNKDYKPITHPQKDAVFKAYNNTSVKWFIPAHLDDQSWIFVKTPFPDTKGLIYAQSFVYSDKDKQCILCMGGAGSLKVWVNDKPVFSEPEERITELDTYKVPCRLKKGYNRVLVQVGYADTKRPNFIVRFTDKNYHPLSGLISDAEYHPYTKGSSGQKFVKIPLFAETFFKEKIHKYPWNPVNYILLAKTYDRNHKSYKAQKLMSGLLTSHPDNLLILFQYLMALESASDNSDTRECYEKIKSLDPNGYFSLLSKEEDLKKDKKYDEALAVVNQMEQLIGKDAQLLLSKIKILASQENISQMVTLIRQGRRQYPDNAVFTQMLYNYYKKVSNNSPEALKVLADYCSRNNNYLVAIELAREYIDEGNFEKGMDVMKKSLKRFPYVEDIYNTIAGQYFRKSLMDSAIVYIKALSKNCPYKSDPYSDIATCYLQKGDTVEAINYLQKALNCDPALSSLRTKMRELAGKPDLFSYFPSVNEDTIISDNLEHPFDTTHHFYYIFDLHNTLVYAQESNEQEVRTAIYIHDDKGIDRFNSIYIPYNDNFQEFTILKAEVVKRDGSRVPANINENEIVFPKLGPGDVVYYHYKLRSNGAGRLGREFWGKFYFSAGVPTRMAQYNVLIANNIPLYYKCTNNGKIKPAISEHEKYKLYSWKMQYIAALKDEPMMPPTIDIGEVLHVSTIPSWDIIAQWYSDITRTQSETSLNLEQLIKKLFPKGITGINDMEKARRIYNYIVPNIAYNSVSFMHSAYVPQKARKTLSTRLGDCKDMATLFVALAREVGLNANLVLVNTRDNGQRAMTLPSMEFNHCIVKFNSKGQDYYLELTDKNLPFRALPLDLYNAQVLNIPYDDNNSKAKLVLLKPVNKLPDIIHRKMKMTVSGNNLKGLSVLNVAGAQTSSYRSQFRNESKEDINKSIKQMLAQSFKKPVEINKIKWSGLDRLSDTVQGTIDFVVKNEVIQVGDMNILKPDFIDVVAGTNLFGVVKREYPVEYWQYENTQQYETELEIDLPDNKSFKTIPSNVKFSFNQMNYQLSYQKVSPHKLLIKRTFNTQSWKNIPAADYKEMETFFQKIIKAESRYISF